MGLVTKLLQCIEFFNLHTLVIGVRFFKKLSDKVKSEKDPCFANRIATTTPRCRRTLTPMIMVDGEGVSIVN